MSYESATGLNVFSQYGVRNTGGAVGIEQSSDSQSRMVIHLTGEMINSGFNVPAYMPKGAHITSIQLDVDEAFVVTGTTPTVIIGGAAPATNGIVLSEAELEAVGSKIPASTGTGTWAVASATGTTAAEKVTKALGGTTPAVASTQGKATLVIEYFCVNKV